jgi:hypothetical protein
LWHIAMGQNPFTLLFTPWSNTKQLCLGAPRWPEAGSPSWNTWEEKRHDVVLGLMCSKEICYNPANLPFQRSFQWYLPIYTNIYIYYNDIILYN